MKANELCQREKRETEVTSYSFPSKQSQNSVGLIEFVQISPHST